MSRHTDIAEKLYAVVAHKRFRSLRTVRSEDAPHDTIGWFIDLDPSPVRGVYRLGKRGDIETILDEALTVLKEVN
jgi:hypothetical protein